MDATFCELRQAVKCESPLLAKAIVSLFSVESFPAFVRVQWKVCKPSLLECPNTGKAVSFHLRSHLVPADALLLKPALSSSQPVSFRDLFRSSFAKQNEFTATPRFTGSSGNIRSRRILGTCGHSKSSFRRSRRRQHSDASGASALLPASTNSNEVQAVIL